ncbi:hypothetical protein D3C75_280190 [compost metagenome]
MTRQLIRRTNRILISDYCIKTGFRERQEMILLLFFYSTGKGEIQYAGLPGA